MHGKEKASEVISALSTQGGGGAGICEQSEQEE